VLLRRSVLERQRSMLDSVSVRRARRSVRVFLDLAVKLVTMPWRSTGAVMM